MQLLESLLGFFLEGLLRGAQACVHLLGQRAAAGREDRDGGQGLRFHSFRVLAGAAAAHSISVLPAGLELALHS